MVNDGWARFSAVRAIFFRYTMQSLSWGDTRMTAGCSPGRKWAAGEQSDEEVFGPHSFSRSDHSADLFSSGMRGAERAQSAGSRSR